MPNLVLTLLLSAALAVPAATAQTNVDGDWEGTWRCDAVDGAGAFTSPAVATISGGRIKLSRAGDASDVVLNGTIDAGGAVTLTGRGAGPDGQPVLSTFTGTLSGRSLTAGGRAVPLGGGAVQTCALGLALVGAPAGPTVLRGSGAPATDAPYPPPADYQPPEPYPPVYDYPPTVVWYDNDFYWRRHRLLRWERAREAALRRQHGGAVGPTPPNPPQVVTPSPRPTSLGKIAVPPPQPAPATPPSTPSRPTSLGGIAVPPAPPPVQSAPPPSPTGSGCRPGRSIGGRC